MMSEIIHQPVFPKAWRQFDPLLGELADKAIEQLRQQGDLGQICPRAADVFKVFEMLPPERVKCVILGQDPYPNPDDAMGIAFSSRAAKLPASLRNIYQELLQDTGDHPPSSADLTGWVEQGVFLVNTALTLAHDGSTHFKIWKAFTNRLVASLTESQPIVWVLWGNHARKWKDLILGVMVDSGQQSAIIESAHPGPLSAYKGFYGSKPFSAINRLLRVLGIVEIDWSREGATSIKNLSQK